MNEQVLETIVRLFASVAKLKREGVDLITKYFVQSYLINQYGEKPQLNTS